MMIDPVQGYEFIDFGDGRRLERFSNRVVDRPAPGAIEGRRAPRAWREVDLRFEAGRWTGATEGWSAEIIDGLTFELRPTESGQVGVFPEQALNWDWLSSAVVAGAEVLDLFAYTGGATLAAARAGAAVVHVDASRSAIAWARRNAELSGLADRPIRWLVDDAEVFAKRESRRGRRYAGFVLDPPSYGHGPRGNAWRLGDQLASLLEACRAIAEPGAFVILTAHAEGLDAGRLGDRLSDVFGRDRDIETLELELVARSGPRLWLGSCARMIGGS